MQRVDHTDSKTARPRRGLCGDFAGDTKCRQSCQRGQPNIGFDSKRGANKRRAGAAHRGNRGHQRIAVCNRDAPTAVADDIDIARESHNNCVGLRKTRRRVGFRLIAGKRGELGMIETHHRGPCREQCTTELGSRWRAIDENRVEQPRQFFLGSGLHHQFDCRFAFAIESAQIDEERIRASDESADFVCRNRHGRHCASGQQHVCSILLGHRIGYAMHARGALADAREHVSGNVGKLDRCMHFLSNVGDPTTLRRARALHPL